MRRRSPWGDPAWGVVVYLLLLAFGVLVLSAAARIAQVILER